MVGWRWADAMGIALRGWSGAVGSCLAIQASILMMGSLLGINQRFEARGRLSDTGQQPELQGAQILFRNVQAKQGSSLGALGKDKSRTMAAQLAPSITRP
jgi:hypothetical protein